MLLLKTCAQTALCSLWSDNVSFAKLVLVLKLTLHSLIHVCVTVSSEDHLMLKLNLQYFTRAYALQSWHPLTNQEGDTNWTLFKVSCGRVTCRCVCVCVGVHAVTHPLYCVSTPVELQRALPLLCWQLHSCSNKLLSYCITLCAYFIIVFPPVVSLWLCTHCFIMFS